MDIDPVQTRQDEAALRPAPGGPVLSGRETARAWRLGWLAAALLAGGAVAFVPSSTGWPVWIALLAGALPAIAALLLGDSEDERVQSLLLVGWAAGGALAAAMTGGVSGAMSAWCLAPVAAASTLAAPRRLAEGAALALIGGAMAALVQLSGLAPPAPTGPTAFILGFLAVATTGLGLAAGLMLTHRRAGERDVRNLSELTALSTLLDGLPFLAFVVTLQGRVRTVRGVAPEGAALDRIMIDGLSQAAVPGERARVDFALGQALREREATLTFPAAEAPEKTLSLTLRRVGPGVLVGVMRDVTAETRHLLQLDQARNDAEQLAAGRARFLANMSHELRTPLNAIMGFSDIMRARMFGPLTDRYGEYAELIHESGRHLLDLINDVLDMSKIEAERFELSRGEFDAREAVNAAMRLLRVQADSVGVQLRGVLPPGELDVDADRRALKQIVLNLVSNALKFTPRGGQVTVTADGHDGMLEIVVADTGVGISPEDLERLGRPYEQAGGVDQRARGTGLGLSLVRAFAQLHGGEMHVESRLGAGTSVSVRMPILLAAPVAPPVPESPTATADAMEHLFEPPAEGQAEEPFLGENVIRFAPPR